MAARYALAALSVVFVALAGIRWRHAGRGPRLQARTWLLVGLIFAAVSAWLFVQG